MLVGIVDLGINNLTSVEKAFQLPLLSTDSLKILGVEKSIERPDLIILPGLGKFGAGMSALESNDFPSVIRNWHQLGSRVVGICLGMQLLATESDESPGVKGLNLINGHIQKLSINNEERIPHTGWAQTDSSKSLHPFEALRSPGDFYFVHSYQFVPTDEESILTQTKFGNLNFVSSVLSGRILGVQFHPEKSGKKGKSLISEIVSWGRGET